MFNWFYALIGVAIGIPNGIVNLARTRGPGAAPLWASSPINQSVTGVFAIGFLIFSGTFGVQWFFIGLGEIIVGFIIGKAIVR